MRGVVDTPLLVVHAQPTQDSAHRRPLRVGPHRDVRRGGPCRGLGHERWQRLGQGPEDLVHARGRQPVVVVGEQRIVGLAIVLEARRVLPRELDVALQHRCEHREVRERACLLPDRLALGGSLHARRGQLDRHAALVVPVAARDAHHVAVEVAQGAVALDLVQPRPERRRSSSARARGAPARRTAGPAPPHRPAASSCAGPRPPGGRATRDRPARPAAHAGTRARTSATGYAPCRHTRSSPHGRRLPRLRPGGVRVVRRARTRQLQGLLHRHPRPLRGRGPRRPAGHARRAQRDVRRRGQALSPAARPALRARQVRAVQDQDVRTAAQRAGTGRRPLRGAVRRRASTRARATTSWPATSSSASAPPSSTTAAAGSSPS